MKKIYLFVLIFSLLTAQNAFAQNFKGNEKKIVIEPSQGKLTVGETLEYNVEWMGIPSGKITLTVKGIETLNKRECYHIVARAIPNKFFRAFYDIEYKVHTYVDTKTLEPLRFEKIRRINNTYLYLVVQFNSETGIASHTYLCPKGPFETISFLSLRKDICESKFYSEKVPPGSQDLFSSLYYFRLLDIQLGKSYPININYEKNNYQVTATVGTPFIKDIRKKGSFPCFELFLNTELIGKILGKPKVTVYFTADSKRIPLVFNFPTMIGSLNGVLQEIPK